MVNLGDTPDQAESASFTDASPLRGTLRVLRRERDRWQTSFVVDPAEPVLVGHFPGYPIVPGVCLIECAHRTAMLLLEDLCGAGTSSGPARPVARLAAVDSARFQSPVFPGDEVFTEVNAVVHGDGWRCSARLTARQDTMAEPQQVALFRLRYQTGGRDAGRV